MISKKRIFLGTAIIRSWNDACNLVKFYRSPIFSRAYRRDVAARSLHTPVFSQSMRASYRSRIKNKVSKFEQKELLFLNGKKGATALFSVRFESSESRLKRFEFDRFLGNETWVVVRRIRGGTRRNGGKNVYEKGGRVGFMLANDFLSIDLPGSYDKCS